MKRSRAIFKDTAEARGLHPILFRCHQACPATYSVSSEISQAHPRPSWQVFIRLMQVLPHALTRSYAN
jgi:hypothetical protein